MSEIQAEQIFNACWESCTEYAETKHQAFKDQAIESIEKVLSQSPEPHTEVTARAREVAKAVFACLKQIIVNRGFDDERDEYVPDLDQAAVLIEQYASSRPVVPVEDAREAFERYCLEAEDWRGYHLEKDATGQYVDSGVAIAWHFFEAAWMWQAARTPLPLETRPQGEEK